MAYINSRTPLGFDQMWADEREAEQGGFADVAADLARAQADYAAQQAALGRNQYPYNTDMGLFLGLPLRQNNEPPHGYYFANCVMSHWRLGVARREVERLIAAGTVLSIVTARAKRDGKPVRCARFVGDQIKIVGSTIEASDGRRKVRLSSNWSAESCLQGVARAMAADMPYGA